MKEQLRGFTNLLGPLREEEEDRHRSGRLMFPHSFPALPYLSGWAFKAWPPLSPWKETKWCPVWDQTRMHFIHNFQKAFLQSQGKKRFYLKIDWFPPPSLPLSFKSITEGIGALFCDTKIRYPLRQRVSPVALCLKCDFIGVCKECVSFPLSSKKASS